MRFVIIIIALLSLILLEMGCTGPRAESKANEIDLVAQKLAGIAMSEPLTLDSNIENCDPELFARGAMDYYLTLETDKARELWQTCEQFYACSPTIQKALQDWFKSSASFKLGFADLRSSNISQLGDSTLGLYHIKTQNIYMDFTLIRSREACPLLLHELAHRFDPKAAEENNSLRKEYRAYWHQMAFMQEINLKIYELRSKKDSGVTSEPYEAGPEISREVLLRHVADAYKLSFDSTIVEKEALPQLPMEALKFKQSVSPDQLVPQHPLPEPSQSSLSI